VADDKIVKVPLRTVTLDVPPQDIITSDNVSVKVNAVVYFRVMNAIRAIVDVENYLYATSQLAQTTLRSVLGEVALDDLLSKRETLNVKLQSILDQHTDAWGIKVSLVEVKQVDLPQEMQRAMAKPWLKLNVKSGQRLFMRMVSSRPRRNWRKLRQLWLRSQLRFSCATCRP
jgi:regulator of protease activity HflC (stomatin/prohibitin superfamily)